MKKTELKTRSKALQLFWNFSFLTIGKTLGDLFTFALFIVLSRTFGKEGIGQYSFAIGLTGFFAVVSDFGLCPFTVKELSRRVDSFRDCYGRIFSLRLILSATALGLLLLVLPFLPFSHETKLIIAVIGAYQVICGIIGGIGATFVAYEDAHLAGLLEATLRAVAALAGIAVVMAGGNLATALATLPTVAFALLFVAYSLSIRKYGRLNLVVFSSALRHLLREATPYALSLFLFQLYSRMDIILLGFFLGNAAVGIYNVGYRVIFFLLFVPHFATMVIFPMASRLYLDSMKDFKLLYQNSLNLTILIGVPTASGLFLIAPDLISLIFGNNFAESAYVLRILSGLFFLGCLNRIMEVFLMACDRQIDRTKCQWKVAWASVLGNLLLIPALGLKGAAVAALISETLLLLLFAMRLKPILGLPRIGSRFMISSVGVASFCIPFAFFPFASLFFVIPVSMILYLGVLFLFKEIRDNEIRMLISIFNEKSGRIASTG